MKNNNYFFITSILIIAFFVYFIIFVVGTTVVFENNHECAFELNDGTYFVGTYESVGAPCCVGGNLFHSPVCKKDNYTIFPVEYVRGFLGFPIPKHDGSILSGEVKEE